MLSIQNPSDLPCFSEISARKKRSNERAPDQLSLGEADLPTSTLDQLDLLSFSIRDYVCRARKKSIRENWPFPPPYLQLCLDHGVKDVLPPFEPPTSYKPWHLFNCDADRSKVDCEAFDVDGGDGGGRQQSYNICVDQVAARGKQEESTSWRPSSSDQGVLESDLTTTSDDLVKRTRLPPKFVLSGREKASLIGCPQPARSASKSKPRLEEENFGLKVAPKSEDRSSVTVGKDECSRMKLESSRGEGCTSKLSALLDPMASKVCPVCRNFSATSNTTLNAHIDQCLALDSTAQIPLVIKQRRHKVKPRKMKSLVEIYATARRCTLEHLDQTNGTTGTLNNGPMPLAGEDFRENKRARPPEVNCADDSDAEAVFAESNGTNPRILSKLTAEEGSTLSKPLKSESGQRGPLTSDKISLVFNSSKSSRLKTQSKKPTMLRTQNHESSEGTHQTCEHERGTEEKARYSGHLKHWVCSKRTVLKKVVCKGQMDAFQENVVQDGDPSTGNSFNPSPAGSTESFVHSLGTGGETCRDATEGAISAGKTLQKQSNNNCYPATGKKLLTFRKKFSSGRLDMPKKILESKDVKESFPGVFQKEVSSTGTSKQIEQVCHVDNGFCRTCDSNDPNTLGAGKESCSLGCSRDPLESETSKFDEHLCLVDNNELHSEEKLNDKDSLLVKEPSGPNELQLENAHHADAPLAVDFDGGKKPECGEMSLNIYTALAPAADKSGRDPIKAAASEEIGTVSPDCLPSNRGFVHLDSCVEDRAESMQSELSGEDSSLSNRVSNNASCHDSQIVDKNIDDESKYVYEAEAFVSQVNTSICQEVGTKLPTCRDISSDAFVGKPTVEQNGQVNLGCPNLIDSEFQQRLFDTFATQITPASTRLSIHASAVVKPVCRIFEPESYSEQSKMSSSSHCQDSDSTRKSCVHFIQDHQFPSPNNIPGWQKMSIDLPFEASTGFIGPQPFHFDGGNCYKGYHTLSTGQQIKGNYCKISQAVSADQQILARNTNSYRVFPDGYVCIRNGFGASAYVSELAPKLSQSWQAAPGDKMASVVVHPPVGGVPTKLQADYVAKSHGVTASLVSDECQARPTANAVLRLMGKNLMVANKGEVESTQPRGTTTTYGTKNHPNSVHVRYPGFSGSCRCKPNQISSNHAVQEGGFVCCQHERMQSVNAFSKSHGNYGNPRIHPLPTQSNNCCDSHKDSLARFCLQTTFDSNAEAHVQHKKPVQNCGQLSSFGVETSGCACKVHKEGAAHFGAKAAQEVIILDDSPEPCRSDSSNVSTSYYGFRCS